MNWVAGIITFRITKQVIVFSSIFLILMTYIVFSVGLISRSESNPILYFYVCHVVFASTWIFLTAHFRCVLTLHDEVLFL